jgi:DNA-binding NarL/FixJ family response regulator
MRSVLEREDDLVVVGEASSEPEAEAVVRAMHPDVALLDLKLSAGAASRVCRCAPNFSPRIPASALLVLTAIRDAQVVLRNARRSLRAVTGLRREPLRRAVNDLDAPLERTRRVWPRPADWLG